MSKYTALLENEHDVLSGTPQSKFWDIINNSNDELIKEQFDMMLERFVAMQSILTDMHGEKRLEQILMQYILENSSEVEFDKKSTYIDFTTQIVSQLDS